MKIWLEVEQIDYRFFQEGNIKRGNKKRGKESAQKVMRQGRKGKIDLVRPEAIITSHYTTIEICLLS